MTYRQFSNCLMDGNIHCCAASRGYVTLREDCMTGTLPFGFQAMCLSGTLWRHSDNYFELAPSLQKAVLSETVYVNILGYSCTPFKPSSAVKRICFGAANTHLTLRLKIRVVTAVKLTIER